MGSGVSSPPKRDRTLPAAPPPAVFHFDDPRPLAVAALGDRLIAGRPWPHFFAGAELGRGTFATVQRCAARDATAAALGGGAPVALKTISKRGEADHRRTRGATPWTEVLALTTLAGDAGCLRLLAVFDEPQATHLLTDCLEGGELFDRIVAREPPPTEAEARDAVGQVAAALAAAHALGVVHRDVKAENLIYADAAATRLVVCDWGLAEVIPARAPRRCLTRCCGSPLYVAPEVLACGRDKSTPYGAEVDAWSLGVVAYICLCGYPPFYGDERAELEAAISRGDYAFEAPDWDHASAEGRAFVAALLTRGPRRADDLRRRAGPRVPRGRRGQRAAPGLRDSVRGRTSRGLEKLRQSSRKALELSRGDASFASKQDAYVVRGRDGSGDTAPLAIGAA
ncbi:serine/threonine kinase [Aureococcus anophagefferens]|nr:serine/threonine kinase [Aureococcus anophagefferens]